MIKKTLLTIAITGILLSGCSPEFWGGAGTGVVGTGAGYELKARQQMQNLEKDYQAGNITQEEYEIRKDQIEKGSIVY